MHLPGSQQRGAGAAGANQSISMTMPVISGSSETSWMTVSSMSSSSSSNAPRADAAGTANAMGAPMLPTRLDAKRGSENARDVLSELCSLLLRRCTLRRLSMNRDRQIEESLRVRQRAGLGTA